MLRGLVQGHSGNLSKVLRQPLKIIKVTLPGASTDHVARDGINICYDCVFKSWNVGSYHELVNFNLVQN